MSLPEGDRSSSEGWWRSAGTLPRVGVYLVVFAVAWFLLKEFAVLLRPLLLAVMVCYVLLPMHSRLNRDYSEFRTISIMAGGALLILSGLGILVYGSVVQLIGELPRLSDRAQELAASSQDWSKANLSPFIHRSLDDLFRAETEGAQQLQSRGATIVRITADVLLEGLIVGLYTVFLLLEARRLKDRIHVGFEMNRAIQILGALQRINDGIANYLKAKVKSSLILAVPVTIVLFAFNVKFAVLWGLLTFFCNFIPYVGSVVGCGSPLLFAFLDLPYGWQPFAVAISLLLCHIASATFVEPTIIGNAVGLSPLAVLMSLTVWGLCWGLVGMFLAVPMTVTMKIILLNIESTRPVAMLLGDDDVRTIKTSVQV